MLNPAWIEREVPLDRCPLAACRRQGVCRYPTLQNPCRRSHQSLDAMRYELAAKLDRMAAENRARDPEGKHRVAPGSIEHERRLSYLKDLLARADDDYSARERAADHQARSTAPRGRPAPAPRGWPGPGRGAR